MIPRVLAAAALAVLLASLTAFFVNTRLHKPVPPAIVTRDMDSHEALSNQIDARIKRLLHDRPPLDRSKNPRQIALTFDDGPYPVDTPLLLDMLAELRIPATFFLIGRDAQEFPELTARIVREGHEVANHTQTHPNLDQLSFSAVQRELAEAAAVLGRLTHDPATRTLMRPPHGRYTEATVRAAQLAGFNVILWSDDPGDWHTMTAEALAAHVTAHASAPDIVLLHNGRLSTIDALPTIAARFRKAGFEFVTVGELLRTVPAAVIDHPARMSV